MRGWVLDRSQQTVLSLRDLPDPHQRENEALVGVRAFSPSPGDIAGLANAEPGSVPGWDGAGIVLHGAPDGSGPHEGEPVIFLGAGGGWAQLRSVPTSSIAVVPVGADPAAMSTIPVPATSALVALRRLGSLLGRRLLIVGANSAVGTAAVQLAARSGATVIAVARDRSAHQRIRSLGAAEVHTQMATVQREVFGALDVVGGPHLVAAYALLERGGTVIALGHSAAKDEHFAFGAFVADVGTANRSISTFFLGGEAGLASEMHLLAAEAHAGRFDVGPIDQRSWATLGDWVADGAPRPEGRVVFAVG